MLNNKNSGSFNKQALIIVSYSLLIFAFFFNVFAGEQSLIIHDNLQYFFPAYMTKPIIWQPLLKLGYPSFATLQSMTFYPVAYFFAFSKMGFHLFLVTHIIFACYFMYLFAFRVFEDHAGAFIAGLVFGLSGSFIGQLTMLSIPITSTWLPLVMLFTYNLIRNENKLLPFVGLSITTTLTFLSGHPQLFVHIIMFACFMPLFLLFRKNNIQWKTIYWLGLALVIGIGLSSISLIPLYELMTLSAREKKISFSSFTNYQMPLSHLLKMVYPYFWGAVGKAPGVLFDYLIIPSNKHIFHELHRYTGLLVFFLAPFGFISIQDKKIKYFLIFSFIFYLLFSLGDQTPLAFLIYKVPVLQKFRGPSRHFLEISCILALLVAGGIRYIKNLEWNTKIKPYLLLWYTLSTCILLIGLPFLYLTFSQNLKFSYKDASWFSLNHNNLIVMQAILIISLTSGLLIFYKFPSIRKQGVWVLAVFCFLDFSINHSFTDWQFSKPNTFKQERQLLSKKDILINSIGDKTITYRAKKTISYDDYYSYEGLSSDLTYLSTNQNVLKNVSSFEAYEPLIPKSWLEVSILENVNVFVRPFYGVSFHGGTHKTKQFPINSLVNLGKCDFFKGKMGIKFNKNLTINLKNRLSGKLRLYTNILCDKSTNNKLFTVSFKGPAGTRKISFFKNKQSAPYITNCKKNQFNGRLIQIPTHANKCINFYGTNITLPTNFKTDKLLVESAPGVLMGLYSLENITNQKSHHYNLSLLVEKKHSTIFHVDKKNIIYKYNNPKPKIYFVNNIYPVKKSTIQNFFLFLKSGKTLSQTAFIETRSKKIEPKMTSLFNKTKKGHHKSQIEILQNKPTEQIYEVDSLQDSFLVINQTYYPGWKAYLNNKQIEIYRTNHAVSGVFIPKGKGQLKLVFIPLSLYIGMIISLLFSIIIVIVIKKHYVK